MIEKYNCLYIQIVNVITLKKNPENTSSLSNL